MSIRSKYSKIVPDKAKEANGVKTNLTCTKWKTKDEPDCNDIFPKKNIHPCTSQFL